MSKRVASAVSVAMALAILAPLKESWRGAEGDSFPFSWYPMFSRPRPDPERADYVVGEAADGTRHIIHSRLYARGTMNQARLQLLRQAGQPATARALCEEVALTLARKSTGGLVGVERVRVVRGWFDMREYFGKRNKQPIRERTYAACAVPPREPPGSEAPSDPRGEPDDGRAAEPGPE